MSACTDTEGFVDSSGGICTEWQGYDCTDTIAFGFNAEDQADLLQNCPHSSVASNVLLLLLIVGCI